MALSFVFRLFNVNPRYANYIFTCIGDRHGVIQNTRVIGQRFKKYMCSSEHQLTLFKQNTYTLDFGAIFPFVCLVLTEWCKFPHKMALLLFHKKRPKMTKNQQKHRFSTPQEYPPFRIIILTKFRLPIKFILLTNFCKEFIYYLDLVIILS